MTQANDDDRLREEFRALRSEMERSGRVPDFAGMMAKARADAAARPDLEVVHGRREDERATPPRRRLLVVGGWTSVAAAAAIVGVLLIGGGPDGDAEFERLVATYASDASAGAWSSPTSALLDVPGRELTRSVPSLGDALRGLDPSTLPSPPASEGRDS